MQMSQTPQMRFVCSDDVYEAHLKAGKTGDLLLPDLDSEDRGKRRRRVHDWIMNGRLAVSSVLEIPG